MLKYYLTGERVGLRAMTREDLNTYSEWVVQSDATKYLEMTWRPLTESDANALYHEATNTDSAVVFVICDLETNKPVGTIGLYLICWKARRSQYRVFIGDENYLSRGFGREATSLLLSYGFEKLNLELIYLGVSAENERAIKMYERVGFVHEGKLRKFIYSNGGYHDCVNMSILRDEYFDHSSPN